MIYISSKSLYRKISPKLVTKVRPVIIDDKTLKLGKNDVIITQDEVVAKIARKGKIKSVLVLKNNYFSSQSIEYFDFFTTEKNLNLLISMLIKNGGFNRIKISNRTNIINFVLDTTLKRVLLLKRNKPFWGYEPVKGGIEKNETPEEAVIRETYEECGLKVTNLYRLPKKIKYNSIQFDTNTIRKIKALVFVSKVDKEAKSNVKEKSAKIAFDSSKWVPLKQAKNMFVLPRYGLAFSYLLEHLNLINKK